MSHPCRLLFVIVVSLFLGVGPISSRPQSSDSKPAKDGAPAIEVTLKARYDTVQSGSHVEVEVAVTNISGRAFTYVRQARADRGGYDYKFDVHDSSGSAPHDTPFGRALKGREDPTRLTAATPLTGSLVYLEMRPGQILTDSVNLSRLHDLTQPGKYVIQAKAFDIESKRMVESNKITVTVTK